MKWVNTRVIALHEKCPNTELFLVCIFLYSDWIRRDTGYTGYIFRHFSRSVESWWWKVVSCNLFNLFWGGHDFIFWTTSIYISCSFWFTWTLRFYDQIFTFLSSLFLLMEFSDKIRPKPFFFFFFCLNPVNMIKQNCKWCFPVKLHRDLINFPEQ